MKLKDLVSNSDGRLSTTGTIQFLTFLGLLGVLIYSTWLDRAYVPELYSTLALFGGGLVVTKGAVTAYQSRGKNPEEE
ncbi:DUF2644 domain-containing protein [Actinobacillus sp. GY-402]|nr:DUF2644 domain-containing protein [Actinobacillus sp. GY-402]QOF67429.1 DUF2644 domain-containing protein [Actinobacillus sp. GY-402]